MSSRFSRQKPPRVDPFEQTKMDAMNRRYNLRVMELMRKPHYLTSSKASEQAREEMNQELETEQAEPVEIEPKSKAAPVFHDPIPQPPPPPPSPPRPEVRFPGPRSIVRTNNAGRTSEPAGPKEFPRPHDAPRRKGVSWNKKQGNWSVYVCHSNRTDKIGSFAADQVDEASRHYDAKCIEMFGWSGAKHKLNFPDEHNPDIINPEPPTKITEAPLPIEEPQAVEVGYDGPPEVTEEEDSVPTAISIKPPVPSIPSGYDSVYEAIKAQMEISIDIIRIVQAMEPKAAASLLFGLSEQMSEEINIRERSVAV